MPGSQTSTNGTRYRYVVVAVLAVANTMNFLDRQILAILAEPIRRDLNLSDTQLGMVTGLSFALFYTTFGILIAWLADRTSRVRIMAAACAVWSLCTVGCGLAQNFAQLALGRILVGVGEAGGSPPAYSLISDYFPPNKRGVGLGLYSLGTPFGSMLGAALGAGLAAAYGWRTAFVVVGIPGVIVAFAILFVIKEPTRGRLDSTDAGHAGDGRAATLVGSIVGFFRTPLLFMTAGSSALSAFIAYAMMNWNPAFLIRVSGMTLSQVGIAYSIGLGVAGIIGTFGAGWLSDRLGQRDARWPAWLPAIAHALSLPVLLGLLWAPTWPLALFFVVGLLILNNVWLAPAMKIVQNTVPSGQRAIAGAIWLFVLNLVGLGGGPLFVGMISDHARFAYGEKSLMVGFGALAPIILLTIASHLGVARRLHREVKPQVYAG